MLLERRDRKCLETSMVGQTPQFNQRELHQHLRGEITEADLRIDFDRGANAVTHHLKSEGVQSYTIEHTPYKDASPVYDFPHDPTPQESIALLCQSQRK